MTKAFRLQIAPLLGALLLAAGPAAAQGHSGIYDPGLLKQVNQYENNIIAYGKVCNKAGYQHDLMNLRALAQIADQRLQTQTSQNAQSLKGKGLSDDLVMRQLNRDRQNPNTQYGRDYNDSAAIHAGIRDLENTAFWMHCPPPQTTNVVRGGPAQQQQQQRRGGAALLGH